MNTSIKGAAKRLTLSLIAASALLTLGGCAVYGPTMTTYTDADGKVVTTTVQPVAPRVVTTPYVYPYSYPYYPYAYDPWFVGPSLYFNFGIRSYGGHRYGGRGAGAGRRW
ncbi:MAG: hypothetical protein ABIO88_13445 [Burkholderiaceae bacterium]